MKSHSVKNLWAIVIMLLGWLALIGQLYLIFVNNDGLSTATILTRYFTFFTILSNLLVAVYLTWFTFSRDAENDTVKHQSTAGALTVYIAVVALIYNVVLRFQWQPTGFQRLVDELLHLVVPAMYVLWWSFTKPKDKLRWNQLPYWLIYPLLYLHLVLVLGMSSNYYPYPFINVAKLGYPAVLINSLYVTCLFVLLSAAVIAIGRRSRKN